MSWRLWHKTVRFLAAAGMFWCAALSCLPVRASDESLTLRISDAAGRPGGRIAVVLRTYAPRGVGQGQICLRATRQVSLDDGGVMAAAALFAANPFEALEEVVVFSDLDDATHEESFDSAQQMILVRFTSPSGTINATDGPLAVLYFRLRPDVAPGEVYTLRLDLTDTFLTGPDGQPISVAGRVGDLTIRSPGDPHELQAAGDRVFPGATAVLGIETLELFPITGGTMGFRWDPAVAAGEPTVSMDPRHGQVVFWVDRPAPGLLRVTVDSPDGSLNSVPGQLVEIRLPTLEEVPSGTLSLLSLDPELTTLTGLAGELMPLTRVSDFLEFTSPSLVFHAGFETGGLGEWSQVVP